MVLGHGFTSKIVELGTKVDPKVDLESKRTQNFN